MPQSKYGGIPVEENKSKAVSKYGGVPVETPAANDFNSIPPKPPTLMETIESYLPSARTVAQVGGATVGGVVGSAGGPLGTVAGGAAGAGLGETLYQAVQKYRGQQPNFDVSEIGNAASGGALQEGIGEALPRIGSALASRLYRTSLKPSTTLPAEQASTISRNLLKERIPISRSGLGKLDTATAGIKQSILDEIASRPTAEISPFAAANRIDQAIPNFTNQPLPKPDIQSLMGVKDRLLEEYSTPVQFSPYDPAQTAVPPVQTYRMENPLPAMEAQRIKMGGPGHLGPKQAYGELKAAEVEGEKQFIRGLKEELQAQFPGLEAKNARYGNLLEGRPELERAINRTENRDVSGIGAPIAAGGVKAVTGSSLLAALAAAAKSGGSRTAILADILSHPVMRVTPVALPRFGAIPLKRRFSASGSQ